MLVCLVDNCVIYCACVSVILQVIVVYILCAWCVDGRWLNIYFVSVCMLCWWKMIVFYILYVSVCYVDVTLVRFIFGMSAVWLADDRMIFFSCKSLCPCAAVLLCAGSWDSANGPAHMRFENRCIRWWFTWASGIYSVLVEHVSHFRRGFGQWIFSDFHYCISLTRFIHFLNTHRTSQWNNFWSRDWTCRCEAAGVFARATTNAKRFFLHILLTNRITHSEHTRIHITDCSETPTWNLKYLPHSDLHKVAEIVSSLGSCHSYLNSFEA